MSKVAIVSDSNSGITQLQAEELGITILPMPFFVGDKTLYEDIDLTQKEFYQMLSENANISTSMPLVGNVTDTWDALLKEYDEIVHIPMSSGLSGSCETALMLAQDYEGKVQVVNNQRISVTQRQSVLDAMALAEQGRSAVEIKEILERDKFESSIYPVLSEERRTHYAGGGSAWNVVKAKTGTADPGREAGCICQGENRQAGEEPDDRGDEARFCGAVP